HHIDPAAVEAAHDTDYQAGEQSNRNRERAQRQRDSGPFDDPAKDVATKFIRTEKMLPAGALNGIAQALLHRVVRCDERREDGRDDEGQRDDQAHYCRAILFEAIPTELPGISRLRRGPLCGSQGGGSFGAGRRATSKKLRHRVYPTSMRGSSATYSMSTMRFTMTNIVARTSTVACTTGKSRNLMASTTRRPTPGQANTVSVMAAPPRRNPNCRPRMVMVVIMALRSAWRQ